MFVGQSGDPLLDKPEEPQDVKLNARVKLLAAHLEMDPYEVHTLMAFAAETDDPMVLHQWRKLFAAVKLRDFDNLQEVVARKHRAKAVFDDSMKNWLALQKMTSERMHLLYRILMRELRMKGRRWHSLTPGEQQLLEAMQRCKCGEFQMGWSLWKGRVIRLTSEVPSLESIPGWEKLMTTIIDTTDSKFR